MLFRRTRVTAAVLLAALLTLTAPGRAARAGENLVRAAVVDRLRQACAREPELRGILIQSAKEDGAGGLRLDLLVDAQPQAERLQKRAAQLLGRVPSWRERYPRGVTAGAVTVVPLRSKYLPALQRDFAQADWSPEVRAVLRRTRLDDLHFEEGDGKGPARLVLHGVCAAERGGKGDDPRAVVRSSAIDLLLNQYKAFPESEPPYQIRVDQVRLLPAPARELHNRLVGERRLEDVLLNESDYDGQGVLRLHGFVGSPQSLEALDEFLRRAYRQDPRFVKPGHPGPAWALAGVKEVAWPLSAAALQSRLARADSPALRQLRLDRAYFAFPPGDTPAELVLEGVSCHQPAADDSKQQAQTRADLADVLNEALRGASPALGDAAGKFTKKDQGVRFYENPRFALQRRLVNEQKLDEVWVEDARYDDRGTLVLEGRVGQEVALPALAAFVKAEYGEDPRFRAAGRPEGGWELALKPVRWPLRVSSLQRQLANEPDRLFKQTRIDRAYLVYAQPSPAGLELRLEGVCCNRQFTEKEGAERLKARLGQLCNDAWPDLKPPRQVYDGIEFSHPPSHALQARVAEFPELDGVCFEEGVAYDADGRLALRGFWRSPRQEPALLAFIAEVLEGQKEAKTVRRGVSTARLDVVETDRILTDLRRWVAGHLDDARVDRLFFDAEGRVRLRGLYAHADDDAKILQRIRELLQGHPQRERLQRPAKEAGGDQGAKLEAISFRGGAGAEDQKAELRKVAAPLSAYLREQVAGVSPRWHGTFIERGFYDVNNRFTVKGAVDRPDQVQQLRWLLDELAERPAFRKALETGVRLDEVAVLPLNQLLDRLRDVTPAYERFDGIRLTGAYYDPQATLVLTGYRVEDVKDVKAAKELAQSLLRDDPRGRRRTGLGLQLQLVGLERDPQAAQLAINRSLRLLQQSLPDSLNPVCLTCVPPLVPPYEGLADSASTRLPEAVVRECVNGLEVALLHAPEDTTAWYLRALCLFARGEQELAARDLRRLYEFEKNDPVSQTTRLARLELLQGALRTLVSDYANHVAIRASGGRPLLALNDVP